MIVDLSVRLKQLRLDKQLRQEQVARLVGVSKGAISAYETDIRQPSYDVLIRLANLYRVRLNACFQVNQPCIHEHFSCEHFSTSIFELRSGAVCAIMTVPPRCGWWELLVYMLWSAVRQAAFLMLR